MRTFLLAALLLALLAMSGSAQMMQTGIGPGGAASGGGAGGCTGTIDLSTGCAQPMLGVL